MANIITTKVFVLNSSNNLLTAPTQLGKDQMIVKFVKSSTSGDVNNAKTIIGQYGSINNITKLFTRDFIGKTIPVPFQDVYSVEFSSADTTVLQQIFNNLKIDSSVEKVQWNYKYKSASTIPNDPDYTGGGQWSLPLTQAPQGWDITTGSPSAVIAVIGTGVNFTHEDLAANIWSNPNETSNGSDDDGNGYVDDIRGWDFNFSTPNCNNNTWICGGDSPSSSDPHETEVAGIAAAVGNNGPGQTGQGIAGVCWSCKIMPLRVDFSSAQVVSAINYAVNKGTKIIVMSFSTSDPTIYGSDILVQTAIDYAAANGVLMIAAAGNDNSNTLNYPAAFGNVIGVAATDSSDQRASTSNWGSWVKVAAPGVALESTTFAPSSYANQSGTSISAGFVAGIAGLIFSKYPSISVANATNAILTGVDIITQDHPIGSGRVNVLKALQAAAPTPTPTPTPTPDTIPPTISITNPPYGVKVGVNLSINIKATATDNIGVSKVEFYIDSALKSTSTSAPYVYTWDTTGLATSSSHTIMLKAYDTSNNSSTSTETVKMIQDTDADGFSDDIENYIGTNPNIACGANNWPPDFNNSGKVDTSDVLHYTPVFNSTIGDGKYNKRYDLNMDGKINTSDVLTLSPVFNKLCPGPLYQ